MTIKPPPPPADRERRRSSLLRAPRNEAQMVSAMVGDAIAESAERRREQEAFVARGVAAGKQARRENDYIDAEALFEDFEYRYKDEVEARKPR